MIFFITHSVMFCCIIVVWVQCMPFAISAPDHTDFAHWSRPSESATESKKIKRQTSIYQMRRLGTQIVEILFISILMTAIITGSALFLKDGLGWRFVHLWLKDFVLSCRISIPAGYLIVPLVVMVTKRFNE
jgi:ABC-type glycerol-3-phosphate transport system permease component